MSFDPYQIPDPVGGDPYNVPIDEFTLYDRSQQAMLLVHPYILLGAVVILTIGGIYSGIIYPILSKIFTYFNTGYAHKSRLATIFLSAFAGVVAPILFFTGWWFGGQGGVNGFLNISWNYLDYWKRNDQFVMPGYLFWYIYSSYFMNIVLNLVFCLFSRWHPIPTEIKQCSERHAFVIVSHNSTWKLAEPIKAILKFAQPHQIYIADNGSTETEQQTTRDLCESLSTEHSKIQVSHLPYGNKTLAQYACVLELIRRFNEGSSDANIITLIDDDVFIPETFPSFSIERQFEEDPSKVAIAYPLRIANTDASYCATLQDAEYFTGNVARYIQDLLGSQLFASGAIATWNLAVLEQVLLRHATNFNGEDLEMGYILHKLCANQTSKLHVDGAVRIGFERNCCVPTTAPVHFFHWYDILPGPLRRKWVISSCSCKEASFFNQRLRSWDPACHAYLFRFLQIIFSPRGGLYAPKWFIRILCTWKVVSILREYLLVFGIVFSIARIRTLQNFTDLAIFYADSIIVSWAFGILSCLLTSKSVSRQGFSIRPDIVFTYPILLELPYGSFIRPISAVYFLCYYYFFERFPPTIKQQLKDPEKAKIVTHVWENSSIRNSRDGHSLGNRSSLDIISSYI